MDLGGRRSAPLLLTRFFGRESETVELMQLLHGARLVTLTGAPGCGKTRLSQEVAAELASRFSGGVFFVELGSITDPTSTTPAVAAALGVRDRPHGSLEDTLVEHLAAREILLVLDNCEHLLVAVADLVELLLAQCPGVRLLATSRMALGVSGEQSWPVPPLDLVHAADLFVDRARLAAPDRQLDRGDRIVERICTRLDGLPLALELAAAWTRVLSPTQILDHLDQVLTLPNGRASRGPARQRTMEETVAWSYRLLPPTGRLLFERLSVFAGGFDLEAAQAVAADDDLLSGLASLVEHSLVLTAPVSGRPMRYRLLEPLRQFAAARLAERGGGPEGNGQVQPTERNERDEARRRHAQHFLALALRADGELRVREPRAVLERLELDEGNFRVALDYAAGAPGGESGELGLRLCTALARSWALRGRVNEGRARMDDVLRVETPDRELRGRALAVASRLAWRQLDYGATRALLDESLVIATELGDRPQAARRLRSLAMVAIAEGDLGEAQRLCRESIDIFRAEGDHYGLSLALAFLGLALQLAGQHAAGSERAQEALDLSRAHGNLMGAIYGLAGMAFGAIMTGNTAPLMPYREETASVLRALGGMPEDPGWMWTVIAFASAEGHYHLALRLAGAVEARARRDGVELHEPFRRYMLPWLERARARVGSTRAAALAAEGSTLTADEVIDECLRVLDASDGTARVREAVTGRRDRADGADGTTPLSSRELEVADLVARGLSNGEIAELLLISKRTVESHLDHIKQKLALTRRSQIVAWATEDRGVPSRPTS